MKAKYKSTISLILVIFTTSIWLGACSAAPTDTSAADMETTVTPSAEPSITAEGRVIPVRHVELVFTASGVIEDIYFEEGEQVKKGEVIARLEGLEHLQKNVTDAKMELLAAQQALNDLSENAAVNQSNARLALAKAETAYDDAQDDLEKIDWRYGNPNAIDEAYAAYILAQKKVEDAEKDFDDVSFRTEDDEMRAGRLSVLASARAERDRALAALEYVRSKPDEFEVKEAQSQVEVALAELEDARHDWELMQEDGIDPDEYALAQTRLEKAQVSLAAAQADLDDIELIAPFDGTIISIDARQGEYAGPSSSSIIVADTSQWQVETTDLTELDIASIEKHMEVVITFDAIPDLALDGNVLRIKSLGENKQGDITYTVLIQPRQYDDRLLWNMTAFVKFIP